MLESEFQIGNSGGVTQSGLILTSNRGLREDMAQLEHGQAKLEGLLEGLREAITVRTASS